MRRSLIAVLVGTSLATNAVVVPSAFAIDEGVTYQGGTYASGGVGEEEREALREWMNAASLKVTTVESGSGTYLANALVIVTDQFNRQVFAEVLDGPFLGINLDPGPYTVTVMTEGKTQSQRTMVGRNGHRELLFRF